MPTCPASIAMCNVSTRSRFVRPATGLGTFLSTDTGSFGRGKPAFTPDEVDQLPRRRRDVGVRVDGDLAVVDDRLAVGERRRRLVQRSSGTASARTLAHNLRTPTWRHTPARHDKQGASRRAAEGSHTTPPADATRPVQRGEYPASLTGSKVTSSHCGTSSRPLSRPN